jgi:broad specificity phosphatase PhoE
MTETGACTSETRIVLVRHGQSTWNADGRWQGHADPPLSALGEAQARAAADGCPAVDVVVASDLVRAQQTAEIIAGQRRFGPVRPEPRLRETFTGEWTGLTRDEIEEAWPGWLAADRRPAGFESWEAVAQRATSALKDLHAAHRGGTVLAVAHAGVIRAVERGLDVLGSVPKNLGGRWFRVNGDGLVAGDVVVLIDHANVVITAPDQL